MYETSTEAVYLVYIINQWDKITNKCSINALTNENTCSIIAFSENKKTHPKSYKRCWRTSEMDRSSYIHTNSILT